MNTLNVYQEFLRHTGEPTVAALLTVANAFSHATPAAAVEHDALLKPSDVAREVGVSQNKVLAWVRAGALPAANLATGRRPRFVIRRVDLDAFLLTRQPAPRVQTRRSIPSSKSKRY